MSLSKMTRYCGLTLVLGLAAAGSAHGQDIGYRSDNGTCTDCRLESLEISHAGFISGGTILDARWDGKYPLTAVSHRVRSLRIVKRLDMSSPLLQQAFQRGTPLPEATLTIRQGEDSREYQISMKNVYITSYQRGGSREDGSIPTETFSLNFGEIEFEPDQGPGFVPETGDEVIVGFENGNKRDADSKGYFQMRTGTWNPEVMQDDALSAARFSITIDGHEVASFSELAGINSSVHPVEFVLGRGKATGPVVWEWRKAVEDGDMAAARKSASLVMYDYEGKPVARYHLVNAWPSKVEIGGLAGQGNVSDIEFLKARASRGGEVAMETVTIVCERIQRASR